MMRTLMQAGYLLLFGLVFLGLSSCDAPGNNDYSTWDADRNDMLDENEFYSVYDDRGYWNDWDRNNDGFIDNDEWDLGVNEGSWDNNAAFNDYDMNNDGMLDENEFRRGVFNAWDTDRDGYLNENEFNSWYDS